jgi:hypothetical protein
VGELGGLVQGRLRDVLDCTSVAIIEAGWRRLTAAPLRFGREEERVGSGRREGNGGGHERHGSFAEFLTPARCGSEIRSTHKASPAGPAQVSVFPFFSFFCFLYCFVLLFF